MTQIRPNLLIDPSRIIDHSSGAPATESIYDASTLTRIAEEHEQADLESNGELRLPITGLPEPVARYITSLTEAYCCHRDIVTSAVLTALSTAIGSKCTVTSGRYVNMGALWMLVVAPSGSNKSAPVRDVFSPLERINAAYYQEYERERAVLATMPDKAARNAGHADTLSTLRPKRIILGDVTSEARNVALQRNPHGLLVYRDEARGFFDDMGRYGSSGELSQLLSVFDGAPVVVDRVGAPSLRIEHPFLSFFGTTQPKIVKDFLGSPDFTDTGFTQRMLFVVPRELPLRQYVENAVSPDVVTQWDTLIDTCFRAEGSEYRLSPEAVSDAYAPFYEEMSLAMATDWEDDDYMRSVVSKLQIIALRLALVVQAATDALRLGHFDTVIELPTMRYCCHCAEKYFLPMALRAKELLGVKDHCDISKKDTIKAIFNHFPDVRAKDLAAVIGVTESSISRARNSK